MAGSWSWELGDGGEIHPEPRLSLLHTAHHLFVSLLLCFPAFGLPSTTFKSIPVPSFEKGKPLLLVFVHWLVACTDALFSKFHLLLLLLLLMSNKLLLLLFWCQDESARFDEGTALIFVVSALRGSMERLFQHYSSPSFE